jgi:hypothetical protein
MFMNKALLIDGKEYISAVRAAKKIGYASDYMGQLCRSGRVAGTLIGKTWYVDYQSILEHRRTRKQKGRKKAGAIPESFVPQVENVSDVESVASEAGVGSLYSVEAKPVVQYGADNSPALPQLTKAIPAPVIRRVSKKGNYLLVGMSLSMVVVVSLVMFGHFAPEKARVVNEKTFNTSGDVQGLAFASGVTNWFGRLFGTSQVNDGQVYVENVDTQPAQGFVIVPETQDHIGMVDRIKRVFSDGVDIAMDAQNTSGVITPVFQEGGDIDNYAFVLVPIEDSANSTGQN